MPTKAEAKALSAEAPPIDHLEAALNDAPGQPVYIPTVFPVGLPKLGVYRSIAAIIAALGRDGIAKDGEAKEGAKFKYRGVDQVYAALNPLLAQHNLIILPRITRREETERKTRSGSAMFDVVVYAEFDFISSEDGSKHTVATIGEAFDSGDKATNKAMAVAFKYAAFLAFCVPVEGENTDDPDAYQNHDVAPKDQPQQKQQPAKLSVEEQQKIARAEYDRAEGMLRACIDVAGLDDTWNKRIDWTKIPKGWLPRLQKINEDVLAEIRKPRTTTTDAGSTPFDDDIPF